VLKGFSFLVLHETEPWAEYWSVRFKQRAVNEFWTAESLDPIEIHRHMQAVHGNGSYID